MRALPRRSVAIAIVLLTTLPLGLAYGEEFRPSPLPVDPDLSRLPITSRLYDLAREAAKASSEPMELARRMEKRGFAFRDPGLVNVEIVPIEDGKPVSPELVASHGGTIDGTWRGYTSAWIPPARSVDLARILPEGYLLRHASLAYDNWEGPQTMELESYIDPGPAGAGILVGVIDRNFNELSASEHRGHAPVGVRHNYTSDDFEVGISDHGTAHLETVFDNAPAAEYHLFRIWNATHLGMAVDDALALGVNVISATQSFYNEGWADNSGPAASAVHHAASNGILYVSSSGNRGETHWQGDFVDSSSPDWLDWGGGDWRNDLAAVADSGVVQVFMQWDRGATDANYDLYLYLDGAVVASSTSGGTTFEDIWWRNVSGGKVTPTLAVRHAGGARVELEVFEITGWDFTHQVPASSITSPNNVSAANCLAIGAVPWDHYQDGHLTGYSSRGPTNSGARGLDLVGPTNTWTYVGGKPFTGTSCSTPNVAGAAAALWSSVPEMSATGIRLILTRLAELNNDWGAPGPDPEYGYGAVKLPAYHAGTEWLDRTAFNGAGTPDIPWYWVWDATANVVSGGRLLFIGGEYPQSNALYSTPLLMGATGENALLHGRP